MSDADREAVHLIVVICFLLFADGVALLMRHPQWFR
jgi:hypothetical protein